MKKLFVACVALVIALLVIVGIIKIGEHKDSGMSDQEMMELSQIEYLPPRTLSRNLEDLSLRFSVCGL